MDPSTFEFDGKSAEEIKIELKTDPSGEAIVTHKIDTVGESGADVKALLNRGSLTYI